MQLRSHQAKLTSDLLKVGQQDLPLSILAYVVPGGGKSWLPGIVAKRFPGLKIAWFVPRLTLRQQAAQGSQRDFGIPLWESENETNPSRGLGGFVATHQALTMDPKLYEDELKRSPYILVTDEIHHAKIARKDGEPNQLAAALTMLAPLSRVHLMMSGTLETNDGDFIWGIDYEQTNKGYVADPESSAKIYIRYDRPTALQEGAIVPIKFYHHDGPVSYVNGKGIQNKTLSLAATRKEESETIFVALRTEIADELLSRGVNHWKNHGKKLAIICDTQYSAKKYYKALSAMSIGEVALAITEQGAESAAAIKRFKSPDCNIAVSCGMIYEGHDNPPITHIICLTDIRSTPWIEQMLARAWRSFPGKSECWAFVPDDPRMNRVIESIRCERLASIGFEGASPKAEEGSGDSPEDEGTDDGETSVIAIRSSVDFIRTGILDAGHNESIIRAMVVDAFSGLGLPEDHPLIADVVKAKLSSDPVIRVQPLDLTPSEEATRLRKSIHSACCAKDAKEGVDFGTHQKELCYRTGVIFKDASLEELRRVAIVAANLCA